MLKKQSWVKRIDGFKKKTLCVYSNKNIDLKKILKSEKNEKGVFQILSDSEYFSCYSFVADKR